MYIMSKSIKKFSLIISLSITIIFFILFCIIYPNEASYTKITDNNITNIIKTEETSDGILGYLKNQYEIIDKQKDQKLIDEKSWILKIEKIDLEAEISNGTTDKVLNKYIGHFKETSKDKGNIGLAAHNRGYDVNYFSKINLLEKGDIIKYFYAGKRYTYEVYKNYIILDTDWSVLKDNQDEITLITCVENKPAYRRCVKAKLIKID